MNYTKESFEEVLQQAYDELEPQGIVSLLLEARNYFLSEDFKNQKIRDICNTVAERRAISFKQWKAISAYVSKCKKSNVKKF